MIFEVLSYWKIRKEKSGICVRITTKLVTFNFIQIHLGIMSICLFSRHLSSKVEWTLLHSGNNQCKKIQNHAKQEWVLSGKCCPRRTTATMIAEHVVSLCICGLLPWCDDMLNCKKKESMYVCVRVKQWIFIRNEKLKNRVRIPVVSLHLLGKSRNPFFYSQQWVK